MPKKIIFICILLVNTFFANAQQPSLQLLTKSKQGAIYLRWSPSNGKDWDLGNKRGYKLTREIVRRGNKKTAKGEESKEFVFRLADKSVWEELAKRVPNAKIPKGYLFDDPILPNELVGEELNDALNGRMIFTLLTADLSYEIALKLGLGFIDSTAMEGITYQYTLQLNEESSGSKVTTTANLETPYFSDTPQNLVDEDYSDSTVTLAWNAPKIGVYSAYLVEKSIDGGATYIPADDVPYLPLGDSKNSSKISYGHKVNALDRYYQFRVRGIDPFGDLGSPSSPIRFFAFRSQLPLPDNLRHIFPSRKEVILAWDFPDSLKSSIQGFHVYRNFGIEEVTRISDKLVAKESPIFKGSLLESDENIVYKVTAVDLRGRETFSAPYTVTVIDSIAPQKVLNLEGEISEEGVVKLCWNIPPDKDIYAYDIERAEGNFRNLFYPVRQVFHKLRNGQEFIAYDTVTVGKGTFPYVYYQVIPSDNHTNYTSLNDSLKLYRPDITPPIPPQFKQVSYTDSTVNFEFLPSASFDVEQYVFYKNYLPDTSKTLLKKFVPDSLTLGYIDIAADEGVPIRYVLEAIDGVGNTSADSCRLELTIEKPFARPSVENFTVKYDKDTKTNFIQWQYKTKRPVITYWVCRQTNEKGDFARIKVLNNGETQWKDDTISKNSMYAYRIYAICDDNTRSSTGKHITVTVK